ncbi:hypothetical protein FHR92_001484 [Fontibacillus solani]|uniref:Uncharacterized protein n=1 Tax=Fontibacillus solani TaxID=1572857 RepID=A0A7W3XQV9_9BACL|nr:hypothetical protein [Fontibacillus solani]
MIKACTFAGISHHALLHMRYGHRMCIDSTSISCPCLVIKAVNCDDDNRRGRVTAEHLRAEFHGLWNTTHTGVLVGQRYIEAVDRIIEWLKRF